MRSLLLVSSVLALSACAIPQYYAVPESLPPADAPIVQAQETPPHEEWQPLIFTLPVAVPPEPRAPAPSWATAKPRPGVRAEPMAPAPRPEPMTLPTAMIKDAQRAAHVEPQRRGYHGASATQRWIWQPGKLYVVYVCPSQMTKIATPPGELLISKVFLDPDAWDVQSYRVGNESLTQDVVFVRPQEGKGAKDVDVALLTEQGHSYDIHLKVGTVCMFGVTWDTPSVPQIVQDEAPLRSTP